MLTAFVLAYCRLATLLVFLLSCASKARDLGAFVRAIGQFRLLPERLSPLAAWLILLLEATVVVLLLAGGGWLLPGFVLAAALLLGFSAALATLLVRGMRVSCNCFGPGGRRAVTRSDLWRNGAFIGCASGGCLALLAGQPADARVGLATWGLAGITALIFVAICLQLGEIVALLRARDPSR